MPSERSVPLPRGWSKHVKSGLLHAVSLACLLEDGVVSENSNTLWGHHLPNV
jgi:hypothetical protein